MAKKSSSTSPIETSATLLEIGQVGRPHGLKGEVVVRLVSNVNDRLAPGSVLECQGRELVVGHARPLLAKGGRNFSQWVVQFESVHSREAAQALTGALLRAEPREGAEELWVHRLIGSEVVSVEGERLGTVVSVEANPASDLLVLGSGALVPLRFVVAQESGRVTVDPPAGLLDY